MAKRSRSKAPRVSVTVIGSGNVAQALAPALRRAGYKVDAVLSRPAALSVRRARALALKVGAETGNIGVHTISSKLTWLCVSDDAIAQVASTIAIGDWGGKFVFHSSGALGSDELGVLKRRGAAVASVHPMMTFVAGVQPRLKGVPF